MSTFLVLEIIIHISPEQIISYMSHVIWHQNSHRINFEFSSQLNKVITIERIRLNPGKFARAMEAALIAVLSGTLMILLLYLNPYCREIKCDIDDDLINEFNYLRMNCKPNEYNTMSLLSFGTPEIAVKGRDRKREKFCLFW